jgi:hypothetical protein
MSNALDLTGQHISDTYERIVQTDGGYFYDGLGNTVSIGAGSQGSQGPRGDLGTSGVQGSQGVQGFQGPRGDLGITGVQGVQGIGYQGFQGVGYQGFHGTQGWQGFEGSSGAQGVQGFQGIGSSGAQGFQGVQGIGYQGFQGVGYQGFQGQSSSGAQGVQGRQGWQGASGAQGLEGPAGTDNVDITSGADPSVESGMSQFPVGDYRITGTRYDTYRINARVDLAGATNVYVKYIGTVQITGTTFIPHATSGLVDAQDPTFQRVQTSLTTAALVYDETLTFAAPVDLITVNYDNTTTSTDYDIFLIAGNTNNFSCTVFVDYLFLVDQGDTLTFTN